MPTASARGCALLLCVCARVCLPTNPQDSRRESKILFAIHCTFSQKLVGLSRFTREMCVSQHHYPLICGPLPDQSRTTHLAHKSLCLPLNFWPEHLFRTQRNTIMKETERQRCFADESFCLRAADTKFHT